MRSVNLSGIENANYDCIITGINNSEAMKLPRNINLTEKSGTI